MARTKQTPQRDRAREAKLLAKEAEDARKYRPDSEEKAHEGANQHDQRSENNWKDDQVSGYSLSFHEESGKFSVSKSSSILLWFSGNLSPTMERYAVTHDEVPSYRHSGGLVGASSESLTPIYDGPTDSLYLSKNGLGVRKFTGLLKSMAWQAASKKGVFRPGKQTTLYSRLTTPEISPSDSHKRALENEDDIYFGRKRRAIGAASQPGLDWSMESNMLKPDPQFETLSSAPALPSTDTVPPLGGRLVNGVVDGIAVLDTGIQTQQNHIEVAHGQEVGKEPKPTESLSLAEDELGADHATDALSSAPVQEVRTEVVSELPDAVTSQTAAIEEMPLTDVAGTSQQSASAAIDVIPKAQFNASAQQQMVVATAAAPSTTSAEVPKQAPSAEADVVAEAQGPLPVDNEKHTISSPVDALHQTAKEFREWTDSIVSDEVAQQYLAASGGNLPKAVRAYLLAPQPHEPVQAQLPAETSAVKEQTLVEEALAEMAKTKKVRKDIGDVLVILDGNCLGRSCRILSEDLRTASPFFQIGLDGAVALTGPGVPDMTEPVDGVVYLFILGRGVEGESMPTLYRKPLSTMRRDCVDEIYTSPATPAQPLSTAAGVEPGVKVEHKATPQTPNPPDAFEAGTDWLDAYRSFLKITARFPASFQNKSVDIALPKLEAIARLANHHRAVGTKSPLTSCVVNLFNRYITEGVLWDAIAQEPARWLMLGLRLENETVFKEAMVHLVGIYPDCEMDDAWTSIPKEVIDNIVGKSRELYYHRMDVDFKLATLSINIRDKRPWALAAMDTWRNWINTHLRILRSNQSATISKAESLLCGPREDFPALNAFYIAIYNGEDSYFPAEEARNYWEANYPTMAMNAAGKRVFNEAFNGMKTEAKEIVKSLMETGLRGDEEELEYLTCVDVEDEDVPWQREVKKKGERVGDDEDEDMEF